MTNVNFSATGPGSFYRVKITRAPWYRGIRPHWQ